MSDSTPALIRFEEKRARQRLLDEFAMACIQATYDKNSVATYLEEAESAYTLAEAMMAARDKRIKNAG